jgi:predicted alpha/beta-hydrolase family hydrolase
MQQRFEIIVEGAGSVSVLKDKRDATSRLLFVYAPGAGSNLNDPFGAYCAGRLLADGVQCWRFQFPYMEAGRRVPDRTSILEATWLAVIEQAVATGLPVVVGGRSMGGRIASHAVAQGADVSGLVLFAYPLHPPGRPDQTRVAHLGAIDVPTLFCSGTRDTFASPDELEAAAELVTNSLVRFLDGADHGFSTLKSNGRSRAEVWAEAVDALQAFLEARLTDRR